MGGDPSDGWRQRTAVPGFTGAVDAATGIDAGISAHDQAHTVRVLADPTRWPTTLPAYVLPIRCVDRGFAASPRPGSWPPIASARPHLPERRGR
jgi:3,4-dihydroxy-2-butanone 4-phosphate synthase